MIFNRVNGEKENVGLTNFKGNMPTRAETEIAKNYLDEKELALLNRMVSAYLDVAEINALNMHPMIMKDWIKELDGFLTMTHKDILNGAGIIFHEKALEKAHQKKTKSKALERIEIQNEEAQKKLFSKFMKENSKNIELIYLKNDAIGFYNGNG